METHIPSAFDVDRPRNIHELDRSELLLFVEVLTRENIQLKVALNKLSTENTKLIEENNRLTLKAKSVEALRMEVAKLEEENKYLKKEMSTMAGEIATLTKTVNSQSTTIAYLLKAHEKQSKLAIRKLLDDAEKLPDKSVLSTNAKNYIATHASKLRRDGNNAAHFFSPDRIREAIKEFSGSEKMKEVLIDLFVHVYGVSFEEDDTIDDEWNTELDH